MTPAIATVAFGLVSLTLFLLDRDRKSRISPALWIPVTWLSIGASRMVSQWLNLELVTTAAGQQFIDGSPLDAQIFAGLLSAGLVVLVTRQRRAGALLRENGPLLAFVLYCGLSILWSDYPFVSFKRWSKEVGDLVMVLMVLTDPDSPDALRRVMARSAFVLIPLSILLIKYYPNVGREYSPWDGTAYNIGVATGKNSLGIVCLIFGLASLWRILGAFGRGNSARRPGPLIAHGALLLMTLWLFWMVDSATSLACFLIGGGLIVVTGLPGLARRRSVLHLLVGAMLFLAVYGLILNPGVGLVDTLGRDATLTGRTQLWAKLLEMPVNPLFGNGYESFWLGERLETLWELFWFRPIQSHNGYLDIFLNLGWIGVALLGLVMAWGYRNAVGALRWDPEAGRLRLAYIVVAAIYNLSEHAFRDLHPVWIAFLLANTVVPVPPSERSVKPIDVRRRVTSDVKQSVGAR